MKIIALSGKSGCGKSTTLNMVYKSVINTGGISTCKQALGNPSGIDFSDIVINNGLKVAFFTMGDYSGLLVNAIRDYNALGIEVLVCAYNIHFTNPLKAMQKIAIPNPYILPKAPSSSVITEFVANDSDAKLIISLI